MTEKQLQTAVEKLSDMTGWLYYHTYRSTRSVAGFPDLVLIRPPRLLFIELKSEKGYLTAAQKLWGFLLKEVPSIEYYIWRPCDLDAIARILSKNFQA